MPLGWNLALLFFLASCCSSASAYIGMAAPEYSRLAANTSLTFYSMDTECFLPPFHDASRFNLTRIDPQTGLEMSMVYTTQNTCQQTPLVAPVGDPRTKRAFVPAYYRSEFYELWGEPMLMIYDMSNPNKALPQQRIPLPLGPSVFTVGYSYSSQIYDAATESVWVMCTSVAVGIGTAQVTNFMVKVDLAKGIAYNVTGLPAQYRNPGNAIFNTKTRRMWFPVGSQELQFLAEYDVDAGKFVNFYPTNKYFTINSMIWDSRTDTTYGFVGNGSTIYYGVLQPGSGYWTILQNYANVSFYGTGNMVLDSSTGIIYGEAYGPGRQFVTMDLKTGMVQSMKRLPHTTNMNLFVL